MEEFTIQRRSRLSIYRRAIVSGLVSAEKREKIPANKRNEQVIGQSFAVVFLLRYDILFL